MEGGKARDPIVADETGRDDATEEFGFDSPAPAEDVRPHHILLLWWYSIQLWPPPIQCSFVYPAVVE